MLPAPKIKALYFILMVSAAMCFIGHGAFGIITKPVWCNYFAVVGISRRHAFAIMPWVGTADILMGLSLLFCPTRAVLLWLTCWGLFTAALRPLSGEAFAELFERAGNFGPPIILLLLSGKPKINRLFKKIKPPAVAGPIVLKNLIFCLRATVFLLILSHGLLNITGKPGLINQYLSLGFTNPQLVAQLIGCAEVVAACCVWLRPYSFIFLILLVWKMLSELFYPQWEIFEWIERGGSYGCLLALWITVRFRVIENEKPDSRLVSIPGDSSGDYIGLLNGSN